MKAILILEYSNGSLPPPYGYFYKISFFETGYAQLEFYSVNNEELKSIHTENKMFDLEQTKKQISDLQENLKTNTEVMVGGEIKKIFFEKDGENYEITVLPNDEKNGAIFNHFLKIYDESFEKKKNEIINKLYNN